MVTNFSKTIGILWNLKYVIRIKNMCNFTALEICYTELCNKDWNLKYQEDNIYFFMDHQKKIVNSNIYPAGYKTIDFSQIHEICDVQWHYSDIKEGEIVVFSPII